jgi:flavin reductase (DIM6/NTAB) family NADH-FMN oxidoreductase RutF
MTRPAEHAVGLRRAYSMFPSGVAAVCGRGSDGEPVGMAMSSFATVSLAPPLVSVCVDRASTTWPRLAALPRLGLSVLGAGHEDACRSLARKTGDRFAGVSWHEAEGGAILLDGSALWIEAAIHRQLNAGDHWIVLLEALRLVPHPETAPLIFHQSALRPLAYQG